MSRCKLFIAGLLFFYAGGLNSSKLIFFINPEKPNIVHKNYSGIDSASAENVLVNYSNMYLDEIICSNPVLIPWGEDKIADEAVVIKGDHGCGQPGGTNNPFCQKLYYCVNGQLADLNFIKSNGQPWAHVSTGTNPGDKKVKGDKKTPEGTFLVTVKDREHDYAPGGFVYIDTYAKLGYDARIGIHDVIEDYWIGQRHSEGCPRLYTQDMKKLYDLLQTGDPVTIKKLP